MRTPHILRAFLSIKSLHSEILLVLPFYFEFTIKQLRCSFDFFFQDYQLETLLECEIRRQVEQYARMLSNQALKCREESGHHV